MSDFVEMPADGLFVAPDGNVGLALGDGTAIRVGLSPDELRAFAAELLTAADRMEADAANATDGALQRATARGMH